MHITYPIYPRNIPLQTKYLRIQTQYLVIGIPTPKFALQKIRNTITISPNKLGSHNSLNRLPDILYNKMTATK